ncbi:MAG: T9SS type A sorting domain-containing protein [Flavobacteriales bacterium]|nr:T9SS type A sorting domain-containing protein [Flavobacteriales bacterium]
MNFLSQLKKHQRFLYLIVLSTAAVTFLQSSSTGPAEKKDIDRTGSPIDNKTCSACHKDGNYGSLLEITLKDDGGDAVTRYVAGETYTLEATVSGTSGSVYGFQGVALTDANDQAGDFSNPSTKTQITTLANREYVEHSGDVTSTGNSVTWETDWTAPTSGTGVVTFYASGIIGNNNGSTSNDDPTDAVTLEIPESTVSIEDRVAGSFSVYPNPATDYIIINTGNLNATEVRIVDITGKAVISADSNSQQIDVSGLSKGIYVVQLINGKSTKTEKLVKL